MHEKFIRSRRVNSAPGKIADKPRYTQLVNEAIGGYFD